MIRSNLLLTPNLLLNSPRHSLTTSPALRNSQIRIPSRPEKRMSTTPRRPRPAITPSERQVIHVKSDIGKENAYYGTGDDVETCVAMVVVARACNKKGDADGDEG